MGWDDRGAGILACGSPASLPVFRGGQDARDPHAGMRAILPAELGYYFDKLLRMFSRRQVTAVAEDNQF